ncbi:YitT family protein [Dongia sp.]|uniref:membrane protein YczE n=1 Tax=Dongia sp. TaxID=1977262 RepID=UPI0035B3AEE3
MSDFLLKRLIPLLIGFVVWGLAVALQVRADLGLSPWDVFHQGLGNHLGIGIGWAGLVTSVGVLLLWIPLKMKPHVGTVLNALVIGPSAEFFLTVIDAPENIVLRWAFMLGGILLMAVGSALYLPARLGTGPRDGVMVGLNRKFEFSIRLSRTIVEAAALIVGYLLGGTVGLGTILIALGLGPTVQACLQARRHLAERLTGQPQSVL